MIKAVYLKKEVENILKNIPKGEHSKYICEAIKEKYFSEYSSDDKEDIIKKIKEKAEREIELLNKKFEEEKTKFTKEELKELEGSRRILNQNYNYLEGRKNRFNNLFKKNLTLKQFEELINEKD